jgi:hypothetical protein
MSTEKRRERKAELEGKWENKSENYPTRMYRKNNTSA